MQLPEPFYRFPLKFDTTRMQSEVDALPAEAWLAHPQAYAGNSAIPLIEGGVAGREFEPPMRMTVHLRACPYIQQVLGEFGTLIGRARLMRLDPGSEVPAHADIRYYWRRRTRVHVPVSTDPTILFSCDDAVVHMEAGSAWTFDNWRRHSVVNPTETVRRMHLVFDTYGTSTFWQMAEPPGRKTAMRFVPFEPWRSVALNLEVFGHGAVLPPAELEMEAVRILGEVDPRSDAGAEGIANLQSMLRSLCKEWRIAWCGTGTSGDGIASFRNLLEQVRTLSERLPKDLKFACNGVPVTAALSALFEVMLPEPAAERKPNQLAGTRRNRELGPKERFDRPVFIVSAPRAGSTLLYEMLELHRDFWTVGGESHGLIESIHALHPGAHGFRSNRLVAADCSEQTADLLYRNFLNAVRDRTGKRQAESVGQSAHRRFRLLEKTPKNGLRIPFLKAAFPDAKFIFLHRRAEPSVASIFDAWHSGRFVTYPRLPNWHGLPWSLTLIPGWEALDGAKMMTIAMRQWQVLNETILSDLEELSGEAWLQISYEDLTGDPAGSARRLCEFCELDMDQSLADAVQRPLPLSRSTLSPPEPTKWQKYESMIADVMQDAERMHSRLEGLRQ